MRGKKKKMPQAMAFIVLSAPFAIFVFAGHSVASLLVGIALYIVSSRRIKANP